MNCLIPVTENFPVPTTTRCGFGTLGESLFNQIFFSMLQQVSATFLNDLIIGEYEKHKIFYIMRNMQSF